MGALARGSRRGRLRQKLARTRRFWQASEVDPSAAGPSVAPPASDGAVRPLASEPLPDGNVISKKTTGRIFRDPTLPECSPAERAGVDRERQPT